MDKCFEAKPCADLNYAHAVPALEAMPSDANPYGRIAAVKALVVLGATSSQEAISRAIANDTSWAKAELECAAVMPPR